MFVYKLGRSKNLNQVEDDINETKLEMQSIANNIGLVAAKNIGLVARS